MEFNEGVIMAKRPAFLINQGKVICEKYQYSGKKRYDG